MIQTNVGSLIPPYLIDSKSYLVVATDLEGNYSFVNANFKKTFEFLNVDFIGQPFSLMVDPRDLDKCIIGAAFYQKLSIRMILQK